MSARSFTPQKFSPTILKRCKSVIEELQEELDRVNKLMRQRQQQIDMLAHEKNFFEEQSREYQLMASQLKKANGLMKAELDAVRKDHRAQDEISSLRQTLAAKDKLIEELERHKRSQVEDVSRRKDDQINELSRRVRELEGHLVEEQQAKRQLDEQWQQTLDEVAQKIKDIEAELSERNEENVRLEMEVQKRKCDCDQTINQIKKINTDLRTRYQELEMAYQTSPPKRFMSHTSKIAPFFEERESSGQAAYLEPSRSIEFVPARQGRSKSATKLPSSSRPRINNSAYLNQHFETINRPTGKHEIANLLNGVSMNPEEDRARQPSTYRPRVPFFISEQLEREVASTRATLESQYRQLNRNDGRQTSQRIQSTLSDLESKLQRMVHKMEAPSMDSITE